MGTDKIKQLLDTFYNGESTAEEERWLLEYFQNHDVTDELKEEKIFFLQLFNPKEDAIPEGLAAKIEDTIDSLIRNEKIKNGANSVKRIRNKWIWISGIAASVMLFFLASGYFHTHQKNDPKPTLTEEYKLRDTYTDPEDAKREAQKALMLVAGNLSKGMNQLSAATNEINKTNHTVKESLNKINIR